MPAKWEPYPSVRGLLAAIRKAEQRHDRKLVNNARVATRTAERQCSKALSLAVAVLFPSSADKQSQPRNQRSNPPIVGMRRRELWLRKLEEDIGVRTWSRSQSGPDNRPAKCDRPAWRSTALHRGTRRRTMLAS
jgi:hypothetical protein